MDDSQPLGDIADALALNDGQLLSTPLTNYLYRFASVRSSGFLPLCGRNTPQRGKKSSPFLYPTFFWRANEYNIPYGTPASAEVAAKIEVGGMRLSRDGAQELCP